MLRTIAYIIFICTGIFAFTLIVLFFRDQQGIINAGGNPTGEEVEQIPDNIQDAPIQVKTILARLDENYQFRESKERDIFQAYIFQFDVDIKVGGRVRMYVFDEDYSLVRKNLLLLDSFYNFQDSTDFFGKTLYLNDKNGDGQIIRFIIDVRGTTLGFEIVRDEYDRLKGLLLQ